MALVAMDIKRVLAYSTVSQLGYMVFAVGVGAYTAGIFHLVTHAFFKALLFLGAGAVIHALAGEQDLRRMGNLRTALPTPIGPCCGRRWPSLGSSHLPVLEQRSKSWPGRSSQAASISCGGSFGLLTAFLTAFYMFRLLYMTFYGTSRVKHHVAEHLHEAPPAMRVPLIFLAILSLLGGFLVFPPSMGVCTACSASLCCG